jgi:hypothetical protein
MSLARCVDEIHDMIETHTEIDPEERTLLQIQARINLPHQLALALALIGAREGEAERERLWTNLLADAELVIDTRNGVVHVFAAGENILALTAEELLGRAPTELLFLPEAGRKRSAAPVEREVGLA